MSFPSIILVGDSLTEQSFCVDKDGFAASLAKDYVRRADVLNRGLSGYNTQWVMPCLEEIVAAHTSKVLLWIVMIGSNDACLPGYVHHVPLNTFKANLTKMINMIRSHAPSEGSRILIISPPTIDLPLLEKEGAREMRSLEVSAGYAEAVMGVAREFEKTDETIGSLDFYHIMEAKISADIQGSVKDYLRDGLHLGPKGNQVLYNAITEKVNEKWPDVAPKNIPLMWPWYGNLDVVRRFVEGRGDTGQHNEH